MADELKRAGLLDQVGGLGALGEMQAASPAVSNATRYATTIDELSTLRRMIGLCDEIAEIGYSHPEDVQAAVESAEAKVHATDPANRDYVAGAVERLFGIEASPSLEGNTWQMWMPSPYRLTHGVHHPVHNWLEPHGPWRSS